MSPSAPPLVFDRKRLRQRRDRAASGYAEYSFLKTRLSSALIDRLHDISRTFTFALDLGSHTGELSRLLRMEVADVIACDLSPAMAAAARAHVPTLVADDERLPFADNAFDLVASVLSLHAVNDLPGALIQIRRALAPDGLFIAAVFGGETLKELRSSLIAAEAEITGGASPRVSPFMDGIDAGRLLQRAGFAMPVADTDRLTVRYNSMFDLLKDLRGMGETSVLVGGARSLRRDVLVRAAEIYQQGHSDPDGRMRATFEIVWMSGWAPAEGQPVPKRPGSARASLAEAVGAKEIKTGEKPG